MTLYRLCSTAKYWGESLADTLGIPRSPSNSVIRFQVNEAGKDFMTWVEGKAQEKKIGTVDQAAESGTANFKVDRLLSVTVAEIGGSATDVAPGAAVVAVYGSTEAEPIALEPLYGTDVEAVLSRR